MSLDTILTVKNENLERLRPDEAVDFFRELLWAEASSVEIAKNLVNVPSAITVADGGIDAEVRDVEVSGGQGIIRHGLTRYQIKTGGFNLAETRYVREILFRPNSRELRARVKSCLDLHGTLVVVLFGWDNPGREDDQILAKFRGQLESVDPAYARAKLEVWQQNHLIGFLRPFPALSLRANGRHRAVFDTHQTWATQAEMGKEFVAGHKQEELIANLRTELGRSSGPVHIQVWGEAGIGKTRLVLEATDTDDLRPLVVYCAASQFRGSDLMNEVLGEEFSAILVLDECDPRTRAHVWNRLEYHSPRIKVISIYNETDDSSGIRYFDVPPLGEEEIVEIIHSYNVPRYSASRWALYCSGSPRVAHVIGANLVSHPDDVLKPPSTVNIWERYVVGSDRPDSPDVSHRRTVLRHLALFKRFGYGTPVSAEAKAVAQMIERADSQITVGRFQEIARVLRDRRILQGETTLYITPKLLHVKLWIDWWDTYGQMFSLEDLAPLPPKLLDWYLEMFEYAAGSAVALDKVRELLGEQGPFGRDPERLRRGLGPRFFRTLAGADPEGALRCLKSTIGSWGNEQLLAYTDGRREIVWALEGIARWRDLFADAARLLLALGEAENETWSNNASGVFVDLFSLSEHAALSRTGASPNERFQVLKEAMESASKERRALALRASERALQRVRIGPAVGPPRIVGTEPELWGPKTYGELFDAYRQVWRYLSEKVETLPDDDERREAANILVRNARSLAWFGNLSTMVIDTVSELSQGTYVDTKQLLEVVVQTLHHDTKALPNETTERWLELRRQLSGTDFPSLARRYVSLNIPEDHFDEEGNRVDKALPQLQSLAVQSHENPGLLYPELDWLVRVETNNGYRFGHELGKRDSTLAFLPEICEAQKRAGDNGSASFLAGYLHSLFERDLAKWEDLMDALSQDGELRRLIPELTWRTGKMSDRAGLRVLRLAQQGAAQIGHLRMFVFGRVVGGLSEHVFAQWLEFLLSYPDAQAAYIAIDLYSHYYIAKDARYTLPEGPTLRLLTHPSLLQPSQAAQGAPMGSYNWTLLAKAFIGLYPRRRLELADAIVEHFGQAGTVLGGYRSTTYTVLTQILQECPEQVWDLIADCLAQLKDTRAWLIADWLRGEDAVGREEEGALSFVPVEPVWRWVDEDIAGRAWRLANLVPKQLFREEGKVCWAREVLVRYGDREDVRRNLTANFATEGWWGPESLHLANKRQQLLDFGQQEDNSHVKQWVDEYVAELDRRIARAKVAEEREDY